MEAKGVGANKLIDSGELEEKTESDVPASNTAIERNSRVSSELAGLGGYIGSHRERYTPPRLVRASNELSSSKRGEGISSPSTTWFIQIPLPQPGEPKYDDPYQQLPAFQVTTAYEEYRGANETSRVRIAPSKGGEEGPYGTLPLPTPAANGTSQITAQEVNASPRASLGTQHKEAEITDAAAPNEVLKNNASGGALLGIKHKGTIISNNAYVFKFEIPDHKNKTKNRSCQIKFDVMNTSSIGHKHATLDLSDRAIKKLSSDAFRALLSMVVPLMEGQNVKVVHLKNPKGQMREIISKLKTSENSEKDGVAMKTEDLRLL
jgi:hypothetical protein